MSTNRQGLSARQLHWWNCRQYRQDGWRLQQVSVRNGQENQRPSSTRCQDVSAYNRAAWQRQPEHQDGVPVGRKYVRRGLANRRIYPPSGRTGQA